MADLKIWFLDVGHGDCAYVQFPNGARMMIDCGAGNNNWPSTLLSHYKITRANSPIPVEPNASKYALDNLVISHPHGDHISDIENIHKEIGFYWLTGAYGDFIDQIDNEKVDFRKREKKAADYFKKVVKEYNAPYIKEKDRVATNNPCIVKKERFLSFNSEIDFNNMSWLVSIEIGGEKTLFTGDLTGQGVTEILKSAKRDNFVEFVKGTTILKVPHHGRENGCSEELFKAFGAKPKLCIVSDEILSEKNEGTSDINWYEHRTAGFLVDGKKPERKVLTTRSDKDIFVSVSKTGTMQVQTNCFKDIREKLLKGAN